METLSSLLPLPLSYATPTPHPIPPTFRPRSPVFSPPTLQRTFRGATVRRKIVVFLGNRSDPRTGSSASRDENGAIDEMDDYMNNLSLEYDSVWDTKPSWCQPWTIALTGISIVGSSWLILHTVWVTALACLAISAWWYIFLYSYPKAYTEMIAERRKKVSNGLEDTFGWQKNQ